MEVFFGLGLALQAIACIVVGGRLLRLAKRTHRFPEFAFGIGSLGVPGIGFPLMVTSALMGREGLPGALAMHALGGVAVGFALTMIVAFTWRVFRAQSRLAAGFVALSGIVYLAVPQLATATIAQHGFVGADAHMGDWRFAVPILGALGQLWTAWESFGHYERMTKRLAIGLVEATVCNRFLLFGLLALSMTCAHAALFGAMAFGLGPLETPWFPPVVALCGAIQAAALFLAFMPPRRYSRWLASRQPA